MGAMEEGAELRTEAHTVGVVIINVATREGGGAFVDVHATSLRARGTLPGHFFHGGHGMGRHSHNGRQRTSCSGESGDGVARVYDQFLDTSSIGAMDWGGAEAHRAGLVIINGAAREGGRATVDVNAVDVHATSLRARRTLLGQFFHGGHGMGRNRRQRTSCSGESGDGVWRRTGIWSVPGKVFHGGHGMARVGLSGGPHPFDLPCARARARGQFRESSSMGAMERGTGRGAQSRQYCHKSRSPIMWPSRRGPTGHLPASVRDTSWKLLPWGPWNGA